MKKRGRMGTGMLAASVMILGVYAASDLKKLSLEETNFDPYSSTGTLTQSMWNGLVAKLDTVAENHEARLRALEGATPPQVQPPKQNQNCAAVKKLTFNSIPFTTFRTTEVLADGNSRFLTATADINQIRNSKYPNGTAPTWTIEVRCDEGTLNLVTDSKTNNCEIYSKDTGTCGLSANTCYQAALGAQPKDKDNIGGIRKRREENNPIDTIKDFVEADDFSNPKKEIKCVPIPATTKHHGEPLLIGDRGYDNRNLDAPCYKALMCDNGRPVETGAFSERGEL